MTMDRMVRVSMSVLSKSNHVRRRPQGQVHQYLKNTVIKTKSINVMKKNYQNYLFSGNESSKHLFIFTIFVLVSWGSCHCSTSFKKVTNKPTRTDEAAARLITNVWISIAWKAGYCKYGRHVKVPLVRICGAYFPMKQPLIQNDDFWLWILLK